VQRRPLIGLLRAQGVTAGEVLRLVLAEAAVLGAVATALGLLAAGCSAPSSWHARRADDQRPLLHRVRDRGANSSRCTLAKGAVLGIGATVAAALPPALEAVRARPRTALARASLERRAQRAAGRLAARRCGRRAAAACSCSRHRRSIVLGFAALFVLILAAALLTPAATVLSSWRLLPGALAHRAGRADGGRAG
jgi:putative ABC transport system permease protein